MRNTEQKLHLTIEKIPKISINLQQQITKNGESMNYKIILLIFMGSINPLYPNGDPVCEKARSDVTQCTQCCTNINKTSTGSRYFLGQTVYCVCK